MVSIVDDIKNEFKKKDNAYTQVILINGFVFLALLFIELFCSFGKDYTVLNVILANLSIPANIDLYIQKPWTIITYAFTHFSFGHIFFNMLALFYFARIITDFLGNKRFLSLYILGAMAGAVLYLVCYNLIPFYVERLEKNPSLDMIGASGGVIAIIVAAATLVPDYTVYLFMVFKVKIKYIAAFFVIASLLGTSGENAGGELAHLGGAILGFIFVAQIKKGKDIGKPVNAVLDWFKGLFKKSPNIKVTYSAKNKTRPFNTTSESVNPSQEEIDVILDKISQSGYESLTKEEKQKLFKASQKQT